MVPFICSGIRDVRGMNMAVEISWCRLCHCEGLVCSQFDSLEKTNESRSLSPDSSLNQIDRNGREDLITIERSNRLS